MSAKIAKALHEVMQKVAYVQKTGKNAFHGYKYAGEADLLDKLRPAMIEAGLILIPSVESFSGPDEHGITHVQVEYTLAHKDGDIWPHKVRAGGAGGDKNKNGVGDKGLYKAITGANKYFLFKLFQIETGDDPESSAAPNETAELSKAKARPIYDKLQGEIANCVSVAQLKDWAAGQKDTIASLPEDWRQALRERYDQTHIDLKQKEAV